MKDSIRKHGFDSDAKTLVIAFAGQGSAKLINYEWVNFFSERPVKLVNVRDHQRSYYMGQLYGKDGTVISSGVDSHKNLLQSIIEESKCENVIVTGSSMGGYAAVLYGVLLNVNHVISYSAQTFICTHEVHGKNDQSHLVRWAYKQASAEDSQKYFDLSTLDYTDFTGKIDYHWSAAKYDQRYVNHISEFCKTYSRNKYDGDYRQDDAITLKVHETLRNHAKFCGILKSLGVLKKHFEDIII